MRPFVLAAAASVCLMLVGCPDDDGGGSGTPKFPDVNTPDTVGDTPGGDDIVAPQRNPACEPFNDDDLGQKVPWEGFSYEGHDFTCNRCRGGDPIVQGTWRFVDFQTEDPELPLTDNYRETFTFDGNVWTQKSDSDSEGPAVITGWYFCSSKPETDNKIHVFPVTDVQPPNAYGWTAGEAVTMEVKTQGTNQMALGLFENFATSNAEGVFIGDALYCRVGSTVTIVSGETRECTDPFAP